MMTKKSNGITTAGFHAQTYEIMTKRERLANAPLSKRHPLKLTLPGAAHAFVYPVNRAEVAVSGHQDASFTNLYVPHFRWRSR